MDTGNRNNQNIRRSGGTQSGSGQTGRRTAESSQAELQQINISRERARSRQPRQESGQQGVERRAGSRAVQGSGKPPIRENPPHRVDGYRTVTARTGGAGYGNGRGGTSRQGQARQAGSGYESERQGMPRQGQVRQGASRQGSPAYRDSGEREYRQTQPQRRSVPQRSAAQQGASRYNTAQQNAPRRNTAQQGAPRRNTAQRGTAQRNTAQRAGKARRKKKRVSVWLFFFLLIVIVFAGAGLLYTRISTEYTLEAGGAVDPSELVRYGGKAPVVVEGLTAEQIHTPGEYEMKVRLAPFTYKVKVTVVDTIPPQAQVQEVYGMYGESLAPEAFVASVKDGTEVTIAFESEPDYRQAGMQDVRLVLTDKAGNVSRVTAPLFISNLKRELVWEAGTPVPEAGAFLENIAGFENTQISYVTNPSDIDTSVLGTQDVNMLLDGKEITAKLTITDTISPAVTVKVVDGWVGKAISAGDFIQSVTDATEVTYAYVEEPDWSKAGSGSARITATDAAGNSTVETVSYTLKKDTVPPEVSLSVIDIIIGEPVSYKKAVGYSDNCDSIDELKLEVDNSKVDPNTEGTYEVTYTVTDTAGNSTTKTGTVNVLAEKPIYYDEDKVNEEADKVLAEILKDNMTQLEKARAIYNWVHSHIGYINHSEKGDWVRGAYEGLVKRQGDCFVYASTSKVLLTRAGINNMDIVKSTVNPSHYWNLVDVGEGWYHFDATPRKDKTVFFMWTDAQLKEYSESHKNTHIYDASLYPEIN